MKLNKYGNVDIHKDLEADCTHIQGKRLKQLCKKLNIEFADAFVGYRKIGSKRTGYKCFPIIDGLVIKNKDLDLLKNAIEERSARALSPEQKEKRRNQRYEKDVQNFTKLINCFYPGCPLSEAEQIARHSCQIGSGRVGRSRVLDDEDVVKRAVIAHIRHNLTPYEQILEQNRRNEFAREDAREEVKELVFEVLKKWEINPND